MPSEREGLVEPVNPSVYIHILREMREHLVDCCGPDRAALGAAIDALSTPAGWQPIESAPKDGSFVLGFGPHETRGTYMDVIHFFRGRWTITWMEGYGEPTHWQPLPAPPAEPQP